ncbi:MULTISPECIES: hypothetical protein [Tissierella]|uniref:Uncharacterized protein n=1 Tax=Tissierella praeacuta DSM 18095 TaxID=1123404 RepID=A0A1M4UDN6_9FIRM|nr:MULTISPECIES: hypothetical protein [Tissierella]MBU5255791.1 hypothetical protein [Tissierella praeacuta]TCU77219.1 hypothetical protein EV204_10278 [Tissierella praeacuta]SHE54728.1 hypothetical protein SAMN02745784_01021 [Tissierella praeacuta DSM 18095]SUP03980.1 Uncharacterised protein [Tissierella praeacuta]HAE92466.1 hypothetical protein [Tissierella sp.]
MEEVIILIISIVAGMATYIVSNILKRGAVIASAIITLVSGLMLPYFFPLMGNVLATAAACSSYAGMISLENALNLLEMAVISLMTGILFIAARSAYIGIGGRLGTIAAISCFAWLGFKKVFVGLDE